MPSATDSNSTFKAKYFRWMNIVRKKITVHSAENILISIYSFLKHKTLYIYNFKINLFLSIEDH